MIRITTEVLLVKLNITYSLHFSYETDHSHENNRRTGNIFASEYEKVLL